MLPNPMNGKRKIAPRVRDRVIDVLKKRLILVPQSGGNKLGGIKHFHSLAPEAQRAGGAIGSLRGLSTRGIIPKWTKRAPSLTISSRKHAPYRHLSVNP